MNLSRFSIVALGNGNVSKKNSCALTFGIDAFN